MMLSWFHDMTTRLAWPLRKDDTQNREALHIFGAAPQFSVQQLCLNTQLWPAEPSNRLWGFGIPQGNSRTEWPSD